MIVTKQSDQTLTAAYLAFCRPDGILPHDQRIAEALMIPFSVVVRDKLLNGTPQMPLAEEDHLVQALGFDRSH